LGPLQRRCGGLRGRLGFGAGGKGIRQRAKTRVPILFGTLAALVFIYIAIAGILLTCDCLSVEKKGGNAGPAVSDRSARYDVVLANWRRPPINACYGILAVLPVLAIPLLLGGVTNGEFWRGALVSANLLFFFLCVGISPPPSPGRDQTALALRCPWRFSSSWRRCWPSPGSNCANFPRA